MILNQFPGLANPDKLVAIEVWYQRPETFGDRGRNAVGHSLGKTHICMGTLLIPFDETSKPWTDLCEDVFWRMQGENWSPEGEANDFVRNRGAAHTSMCVGDAVVIKSNQGPIRYLVGGDNWIPLP